MTKKTKAKRIIRILSVLLIFFLIVAGIIFAIFYKPSDVRIIRSVKSQNIISAKAPTQEFHYSESQNSFTEKAAASGLIELYIDPDSKSFGIFETGNRRLWSALPLLETVAQGEELSDSASIATLKVLGGKDIYYLNTQDNSLAYKKASYKLIDGGAEFTYDLFADEITSLKTEYDKNDIGFRIILSVTLKDGSMLVDCKHSNLTGNPDAYIESIDLLNSFGAYNDSKENDFLLVPDGSGAIIKTSIYDESFESLSFSVYGNDPSNPVESTGSAIVPAFGIKHGETAFVTIIENGDSFATIHASKATSLSEYNRVFSSFGITPVKYADNNIYVSEKKYDGDISLCYRFLTGNNATYAGLASACREQLDSKENDFLLVPDGSGAIIKTSIYDESFESLSFSVYGNDPSNPVESTGSAIVPAFGIKHGETAFVTIIENGDSFATIHASKATSLSEYNRVFSSFGITPVKYADNNIYVSEKKYDGDISLCYRFLTGNNATYAGLASACREQLIRNSVLSTKTVNKADYIPCFLSLESNTSFEQATDMLTHMKSKGINNISLRYSGAFKGGDESRVESVLKLSKESGGRNGLAELNEYAAKQKMSIYFDINLISGNNVPDDEKVMNIFRKDAETEIKNRTLASLNTLSKVITSVLNSTDTQEFSGFCINDAGSVLYSDFSKNGISRHNAAQIISSGIAPLSTEKSIMAVTGNFYMIKSVDSIVNMPMGISASASGAYVSIPFVPLILHGIVDYTGDAINTQINKEQAMLKYVEYGACPHFAWSYESQSDKPETDIYYYDNTINVASEYYAKSNSVLNDLRDARMTDHYQVADGIFCTEYDTGSLIYVNYTDEAFETLGVTVEARSFIRVN